MSVTNLPDVQREMIQYGVSIYFVLGLIGNLCNCFMFARKTQRQNPNSIFFLYLSIFCIIYLFWNVIPLFYSLNYSEPQTLSIIYCKLKLYVLHNLGQYLRYAVVFACVERFFASHSNIRLRQLSSARVAFVSLLFMTLAWPIISIHLSVLIDLRGNRCEMVGSYKLFYAIYQITVVGIIPPVLMIIFSAFTMYNLRQRHRKQPHARQRDRYLLRMVIGEVLVNVITSIPFSLYLIYEGATYHVVTKSIRRLEIEAFLSFSTHFLVYFISICPFYLFMLTAKNFRNEFIKLLIRYWNKSF